MAKSATIEVHGLREFQRDARKAEKDTRKTIREGLKRGGVPVRDEWRDTFSRIDSRSASKLRIRVGAGGVSVDQPLRKSTGMRPDFGLLQQRYGEQALADKAEESERELVKAVDELADILEGRT